MVEETPKAVGQIFLSCGHEDAYHPQGWYVVTKDYDKEGVRSVRYSNLCSDCYAYWLKEAPDQLISCTEQYDEWFMEEPND